MTKYVLNSGAVKKDPELAKKFFSAVLKDLGNNPKVLFCFFASPREDWEKKFSEYTSRYKKYAPDDVVPVFDLAFPNKFAEQVAQSDVIFLHGGDDYLLHYWLEKFDIPKIWEGKVVAGSSAGSNILSKYFWTCDWRECMTGLGIVPIKFLPHFKSHYGSDDPRGPINWDKAFEDLRNFGDPNLPIHAFPEGNFVVMEA